MAAKSKWDWSRIPFQTGLHLIMYGCRESSDGYFAHERYP